MFDCVFICYILTNIVLIFLWFLWCFMWRRRQGSSLARFNYLVKLKVCRYFCIRVKYVVRDKMTLSNERFTLIHRLNSTKSVVKYLLGIFHFQWRCDQKDLSWNLCILDLGICKRYISTNFIVFWFQSEAKI